MRRRVLTVALTVWISLLGAGAQAMDGRNEAAEDIMFAGRALTIGVVVAPPFLEKDHADHFSGLALDLWGDVARDMGLTWKVVEYDLQGLLAAVRDGTVDVGVSDLSITPEREEVMDFSQPYYYTGLGIAVPARDGTGIVGRMIQAVFSQHVLVYIGALLVLLLLVGTLIWIVERRRNPGHFRPGRRGIGDGLWWSAVTMTAVGYGDATPKTLLGRSVALVWMFSSVALLASFTAGITSSLTVESMRGRVHGPEDLHMVRTGVKRGTAAEAQLVEAHVGVNRYDSVEEGLRAVTGGELDAFVDDRPILLYQQHQRFSGRVRVLPVFFNPQLYGFAFPRGSALRKAVNVAMLRRLEDSEYRNRLVESYLGKGSVQ